ncbi:hypothetical protein GCM10027589_22540 [Actinocorallia lasiicapitis]
MRAAFLLAPILVLSPLALAVACGGAAKDAAAGIGPALTREQARDVLKRYQETVARAGAGLDGALLATVETGPQLAMDTALYKRRQAAKAKVVPLGYASPKFYIPRSETYPRWFAVDAESAVRGARTQHALLFVQAEPGSPWKLAADPQRRDTGPLNGLILDREGYAQAADRGAGSVADAHAALLQFGPNAPGAKTLAAGPQTTGAYSALQETRRTFAQRKVAFTSRFSAVPGQTYALRAKDGGAVVWYVLQQAETYRGANVPVTGELVGLARAGKAKSLRTTTLIQYLAKLPAKGDATVTATTRKAVTAQTS